LTQRVNLLPPFATALSCWPPPVLKGRTCSAYPACAPEVRLSGGHYADIGIDQAHVDGNLVTAPAWPAHPQWLAKFAELLRSNDK
jgi:protease I